MCPLIFKIHLWHILICGPLQYINILTLYSGSFFTHTSGTCIDNETNSDYQCACKPEYQGKHCEYHMCMGNMSCLNNRFCIDRHKEEVTTVFVLNMALVFVKGHPHFFGKFTQWSALLFHVLVKAQRGLPQEFQVKSPMPNFP